MGVTSAVWCDVCALVSETFVQQWEENSSKIKESFSTQLSSFSKYLTWKSLDEIATGDACCIPDGPRVISETLDERRLERRHVGADGVVRQLGAEFRDAGACGFANGVIVSASLSHVKVDERREMGSYEADAWYLEEKCFSL